MKKIMNWSMVAVFIAVLGSIIGCAQSSGGSSGGGEVTYSSRIESFGTFPQSEKASTVTIDESNYEDKGGLRYYAGSDGEKYAKVIVEGEDKYYKVEPIQWRVLTTNYKGTGKALLLAEKILINCNYYDSENNRTIGGSTIYPNNYKESRVRAYLNGLSYTNDSGTDSSFLNTGFLQTAFTSAEQSQIVTTNVDNSAASTTDATNTLTPATSYVCADTDDKIFLLSEKEATSYGFPLYNQAGVGNVRIRFATAFAKAKGSNQRSEPGYGGWWWLRTPAYNDRRNACDVITDGDVSHNNLAWITSGAVVPALTKTLQ